MPGHLILAALMFIVPPAAAEDLERDTIRTSAGDVEITFIGHATVMLRWAGKTIEVDPWSRLAWFASLRPADLVLVTHEHLDHCDTGAIAAVRIPSTIIFMTAKCAGMVDSGTVMKNGDVKKALGLTVEAVPAYNLEHKRPDGQPFHTKGEGNGYIVTIGHTRIYFAGDTENTPEMEALKGIDIAFLPMNLPYTMTPEMVAAAAKAFRPKILYPYHYSRTDPKKLVELMKDVTGVEVRVRNMR